MKLSEAQRKALQELARGGGSTRWLNATVGMALVRKGLVECEELLVARFVYHSMRGSDVQFDESHNPQVWREWWITTAGREALSQSEDSRT